MHIYGMARERHGMCESNMAALCKMGKTQTKPLAEWHGMCESALRAPPPVYILAPLVFHLINTNYNTTVQDTSGHKWTVIKCGRILIQCVLGATNGTLHLAGALE
jgi:hypothetical protein